MVAESCPAGYDFTHAEMHVVRMPLFWPSLHINCLCPVVLGSSFSPGPPQMAGLLFPFSLSLRFKFQLFRENSFDLARVALPCILITPSILPSLHKRLSLW